LDPFDASDPFAEDAGAYLLGALSPDDERAFATHLGECDACAARVAGLGPTVGLLANVTAADLAGLDEPTRPDASLLPALLRRAAFERRRRRTGIAALGAVAAAAVIALAVVLGTQPWSHSGGQQPTAAARSMVAVSASSPLTATAALSSRSWGTEISLDCHYHASAYPDAAATYQLEVVDSSGGRHKLGSWTVRPAGDTRFTSGTSLPVAEIRTVRIDLPDGTPVLQLSR
jgi:hypothetical protein